MLYRGGGVQDLVGGGASCDEGEGFRLQKKIKFESF